MIVPNSGTAKPVAPAPKPVKAATPAQGVQAAGSLVSKAAGTVAGSSSGGKTASPYLDATALANIAAYLNKTNTLVANDQASITADQTGLQNAIGQDQQANQLANLKLMSSNNMSGGLYGSAYGQQLGNQNTAYGQKEDAATSTTNLNVAKLQNAIAQLNASEPIYEDQQAAAAAQRASSSAAKLAPAATKPVTTPAKGSSLAQRVAAQGRANVNQLRQRGTPMGGLR